MMILRQALIASLALGVASPVLVGCAERPGTKKKDDKDAKKKGDKKKDDKKKDDKKKDDKKKAE